MEVKPDECIHILCNSSNFVRVTKQRKIRYICGQKRDLLKKTRILKLGTTWSRLDLFRIGSVVLESWEKVFLEVYSVWRRRHLVHGVPTCHIAERSIRCFCNWKFPHGGRYRTKWNIFLACRRVFERCHSVTLSGPTSHMNRCSVVTSCVVGTNEKSTASLNIRMSVWFRNG